MFRLDNSDYFKDILIHAFFSILNLKKIQLMNMVIMTELIYFSVLFWLQSSQACLDFLDQPQNKYLDGKFGYNSNIILSWQVSL